MSNRRVREARTFVYRRNAGFGVPADVAGNELDRIHARDGEITPSAVVDDARPKEAPLHPAFEWNDKIAGEKWRVQTARELVRVVVRVDSDSDTRTPAFVNVKVGSDNSYRDVREVVNMPDLYAAALQNLMNKVGMATRAVEDLKAVANERSDKPDMIAKISLVSQALHNVSDLARTLQ